MFCLYSLLPTYNVISSKRLAVTYYMSLNLLQQMKKMMVRLTSSLVRGHQWKLSGQCWKKGIMKSVLLRVLQTDKNHILRNLILCISNRGELVILSQLFYLQI